jgi:hypothetical protein
MAGVGVIGPEAQDLAVAVQGLFHLPKAVAGVAQKEKNRWVGRIGRKGLATPLFGPCEVAGLVVLSGQGKG